MEENLFEPKQRIVIVKASILGAHILGDRAESPAYEITYRIEELLKEGWVIKQISALPFPDNRQSRIALLLEKN